MVFETLHHPTHTIRFPTVRKEIKDITHLFLVADKMYAKHFLEMGLTPSFNFTKLYDKRIYTHEFVFAFCEWIKGQPLDYSISFFWDTDMDDKFRTKLVQKVSDIFGFKIWVQSGNIDKLIEEILDEETSTLTSLEIFLNIEKKTPNFKKIRKSLDKMGLTYLTDVYFEELTNKALIFC